MESITAKKIGPKIVGVKETLSDYRAYDARLERAAGSLANTILRLKSKRKERFRIKR